MKLPLLIITAVLAVISNQYAADSHIAGGAVNALGVDLYRVQTSGETNLLLSPYSIQIALAMTYAGAAGDTRTEMQRVLHYPKDEAVLDGSFEALANELIDTATKSIESVKDAKESGNGPPTPIQFDLANRLFAQRGYDFRPAFLSTVKDHFHAPLEEMDYKTAPEKARETINHWVAEQTKDHIRDLIPSGGITKESRLTLVNALYLRAPWETEFYEKATQPDRFFVHGRDSVKVPMMVNKSACGYARRQGYQVVTRPYYGGTLQFVILLPDNPDGLAVLEKQLTPELLAGVAKLAAQDVVLHLPKFRIEPPTMALEGNFKALGMKTAFDDPRGSANFDRMAPRKPNDYLSISAIFHKTYLALDEKGTEAAAATAVAMKALAAMPGLRPPPPEVKVDHPFIFAIQHVPSGACLFLGRVTDPR
jgi:serpin B